MKRIESLKRLIILQLSFVGLIFQTGVYAYFWMTGYYPFLHMHRRLNFFFKGHILMFLIYFVLLFFFASTYGGLKIGYLKPVDVYFSQFFALAGVNIISYLQISLMANQLVDGSPIMETMLIQVVLSAVWVYVCNMFYHKAFPPREILLIHGERPIDGIVAKFDSRKDKYRINKCIDIAEGMENVKTEIMGGYGAVVLWDIPIQIRNELLKYCYSKSIRVYMMPKVSDVLVKGSDQLHLFDTPILLTREYALKIEQRLVKRLIDLLCAVILLVIASPFMLITAIAIKLYDGGPVLYKQIRCTRDGREFYILKFRSMRVDAEKDGVARLAAKNDSRITPVGKVIRAVRIDELPQLFNILKGDMSFIGPRPERPEIIAQYVKEMPEFVFRMKVKAGLAGYAQVYGKYNTTPYDKLKLDLTYIENYSVWLDLKLMLLTLKILFKPESTEGVDSNQTTAHKD
ncbi:MAG: exopolysaccharide biosynthesis polyprenyl glycosylphosphotransferase [Bacillus sp. (in: Bacteria)]|nr:exopolysaccharide biosynthesis polyprenyl glycosylphosphotransferase [Bacillus sp. (in: firmicutes)]MCM1427248.1 exopolysaccharide biosynthesis polyprenyl glycosylphosphotransferase [Eubacterium sp.]